MIGMVLVAAGSGDRLGAAVPKALVEVAGRSLVAHAVAALQACDPDHLVVVAPRGYVDEVAACLAPGMTVVAGGATRAESVRAGLAALPDEVEVVAVHDAARAFAPAELVRQVLAAVTGVERGSEPGVERGSEPGVERTSEPDVVVAAAPGLPVADTLKQVDGNQVVGTVDRTDLVAIQTPQVFDAAVLRQAHAGRSEATDDLALVEGLLATGAVTGRIVVVPGMAQALKVTFPHDLQVATALASAVAP